MKPNDTNEPRWAINPTPPTPSIKVRVWMRQTLYGGRRHPFWEGYRPHLVAKGKETHWAIEVRSIISSPSTYDVAPGAEAELLCVLVAYQQGFEYEDLKRGASFEIREGGLTVGTGIVLSDFEW